MKIAEELVRKKNLEVFQEAVKIADSGKAKDWKDVEHELVSRGYKNAPELLDGARVRAMLDIQCARHRKKH